MYQPTRKSLAREFEALGLAAQALADKHPTMTLAIDMSDLAKEAIERADRERLSDLRAKTDFDDALRDPARSVWVKARGRHVVLKFNKHQAWVAKTYEEAQGAGRRSAANAWSSGLERKSTCGVRSPGSLTEHCALTLQSCGVLAGCSAP